MWVLAFLPLAVWVWLQAQRIDRERGGSATIFDDEGEAFAYLLEDDPVSSIRKPRSSRF